MVSLAHLEAVVSEFMQLHDISAPPIPVERILQSPRQGMWDEVDVSKLSSTFIKVTPQYSPRMSMARLLARNIVSSQWGKERGLDALIHDESMIYTFARMLVMPSDLIMQLNKTARTPHLLSLHFEVPEEDASKRLEELGASIS